MNQPHQPNDLSTGRTSLLSGVYANYFEVTSQPDGIVRIIFRDQIGSEMVDRAHLVVTRDNAKAFHDLLGIMIKAQPAPGDPPQA